MANNLEELMKSLTDSMGKKRPTSVGDHVSDNPPIEQKLVMLSAFLDDYGKNPFSVGDIITPKQSSNIALQGQPGIVVESIKDVGKMFVPTGDSSANEYSAKMNVRVAYVITSNRSGQEKHMVVCFWHEAHDMCLYDFGDEKPAAKAKKTAKK